MIMSRRKIKIIILPLLFLLVGASVQPTSAKDILVFAAASTMEAVESAALKFNELNDVRVRGVFASSAVLAKQIYNGAPADNSRQDLLSNRLAVIVPSSITLKGRFQFETDILKLISDKHFASGDPAHVPLGIYARQALQTVDAWNTTKTFLVRTMDSKMALRLVARKEVSLGIVYASDAQSTNKVKIVDTIPLSIHEPIRYPIALISRNKNPNARRFLEFLFTPEIRKLFQRHGFSLP